MHPELQLRQHEYESAVTAVADLVAGLNDETFNRRPDERRWSIAECIDHLLEIGRQMVPRMDTAIEEARAKRWLAEGPYRYGLLGNWFVKEMGDARLPPRSRLKAPRLYRPRARPDRNISEAAREFTALQEEFVEIVQRANGLDLARIKISSPVTRLLRLSLGQWLEGLSGHQRRHLWQAAQVKLSLMR